jgi:hypothetical protein
LNGWLNITFLWRIKSPWENNVHCTDQLQENTCIKDCMLADCLKSNVKLFLYIGGMLFNATFNNISAISWRSVLLLEETRVPGWNQRPATSHWQPFSQNVVSEYTSSWAGFELTTSVPVVINIDALGSYKFIRSRPWRLLFLYNMQDDKFNNVNKNTTMPTCI